MPVKPYSFRYPYNIETTLDRWRNYFRSKESVLSGDTQDYEGVVRYLSDRDRALEDYLSLGIGQGYIGRATLTSIQTGIVVADTQVTNLSVTVTVPANRVLKISAYVEIDNEAAATGLGFIKIKEDGTQITVRQPPLDANGGLREAADVDFSVFTTPAAGSHTYTVTAGISTNNGRIFQTATNPGFLTVEDVGPA